MATKDLKELIDSFLSIKNDKDMLNFLEGIFTTKELEEIPTRLQIIKMLKKGIPQHEIAEKLGVVLQPSHEGPLKLKKDDSKIYDYLSVLATPKYLLIFINH